MQRVRQLIFRKMKKRREIWAMMMFPKSSRWRFVRATYASLKISVCWPTRKTTLRKFLPATTMPKIKGSTSKTSILWVKHDSRSCINKNKLIRIIICCLKKSKTIDFPKLCKNTNFQQNNSLTDNSSKPLFCKNTACNQINLQSMEAN